MGFKVKETLSARELANLLGLECLGNREQVISEVGLLSESSENSLKFSKFNCEDEIKGIVIGPKGTICDALILSDNPRLDFCRALNELIRINCLVVDFCGGFISESAQVAESAIIEKGAVIGENTIIEHNVVVHKGAIIGDDCIIRSGSIVGSQGFGFEKDINGKNIRFPHLGRLIIGNNVELGALNSVCVGSLSDTVIKDGVKTDNMVHIAHNCNIGKNTIITACAELSGGVTLGDDVWIGPNCSLMQKIVIGDNVLIGLGSVVTKSFSENLVIAGSPAKRLKMRI